MSDFIKTGFEIIGNNFDDYERSKTEKWVSLSLLIEKIKKEDAKHSKPSFFNAGFHDAVIDILLLLEE